MLTEVDGSPALVLAACALMLASFMMIPARAQVRKGTNSITGSVNDSLRGAPIPATDVFLRGTTKGTVTNGEGRYELRDLPDGNYELVFSILGFVRTTVPVTLGGSTHLAVDAKLVPRMISLTQETVTGSAEQWKQLLPVFEKIFLGSTENAGECRIENPEVISLSIGSTGDSLQARTDSTLIVDNDALGYRVYVQIDSCIVISRGSRYAIRWFPRFQELTPKDRDQEAAWNKRRRECYRYSFPHFLRTAMSHRLRKNDFLVRRGDVGELLLGKGEEVSDDEVRITAFNDSAIVGIDFGASQLRVDRLDEFGSWKASMEFLVHPENLLESVTPNVIRPGPDFRARGGIHSTPANPEGMPDRQPPQEQMTERYSSIVRVKDRPLLVDRAGNVVRPFSVVLNGYWGTRRLADSLPFDYEPD